MTNISLAKKLIADLAALGVEEYIVCSGGRNAPLVKILGRSKGLQTTFFFEERAAAFFALGKSRRSRKPVAIVTTSGTAAAELLPAALEAYYTSTPLILITADRPEAYRGTGAPQSIDQVNLFAEAVDEVYEWSLLKQSELQFSLCRPYHINISFDEPLIDAPTDQDYEFQCSKDFSFKKKTSASVERSILNNFIKSFKRPLILLSEDCGITDLPAVNYSEAASGYRNKSSLKAFDAFYNPESFRETFDSVIRIGGVPTHRIWRDLDLSLKDIPVLSISDRPFRGLAREHALLNKHVLNDFVFPEAEAAVLFKKDQKLWAQVKSLLEKYDQSEAALVRKLSERMPEHSFIFLGNSLSLRSWDAYASPEASGFEVGVMRGVNGIDGTIAHFLGRLHPDKENWLLLGDLSALYDLQALAFKNALPDYKIRIVIMNNSGGRIFKPMFKDENFEYQHSFNFKAAAEMFHWDYIEGLNLKNLPDQVIIEVKPQNEQSDLFLSDYKGLKVSL